MDFIARRKANAQKQIKYNNSDTKISKTKKLVKKLNISIIKRFTYSKK